MWPEAGGTVIQGILGRKLGMTRLFDDTWAATATTIVEAGPCFVTQIKTVASDGYEAVQLGFDEVPAKRLTKPQRGHHKNGLAGLYDVTLMQIPHFLMQRRMLLGIKQRAESTLSESRTAR